MCGGTTEVRHKPDILSVIRDGIDMPIPEIMQDAAAEIERLRAELAAAGRERAADQQQIENRRSACGTGVSRMFNLFDPDHPWHIIALIVFILAMVILAVMVWPSL